MRLKNFSEALAADLADPEFVEEYLTSALEEGTDVFLVALKNVVNASNGRIRVSSEMSSPELKTVASVLESLGMRLKVTRSEESALAA